MKMASSCIITLGAFIAAIAVILGAFGAHMLRGRIGYDLFDIYQTANQYMMIHAMALVLYGLFRKAFANELTESKTYPALGFAIGTLIFCGSLYAIVGTGIRSFGAITPIGGVLFIGGWISFALQARKIECKTK